MRERLKIGICQWALPMEGPYGCKLASELGLEGIQLDIGTNKRGFLLSNKFVQEAYLEFGKEFGISFPSIAIPELDNFSMLAPEGSRDREIANKAIRKAIETAEAMKISLVMIPSFNKSEIKTEADFEQAVDCLQNTCDYAKNKGIIIGTENLLSVNDVKLLFKKVNRSNLKLYFDTQNYSLNKGYNTAEMLGLLISYICEVHVKDGKNGDLSGALLGKGDANFYNSMKVLKKYNYSGWIILENYYDREPLSLQNNNPVELLKQDIKTLKEVINGR